MTKRKMTVVWRKVILKWWFAKEVYWPTWRQTISYPECSTFKFQGFVPPASELRFNNLRFRRWSILRRRRMLHSLVITVKVRVTVRVRVWHTVTVRVRVRVRLRVDYLFAFQFSLLPAQQTCSRVVLAFLICRQRANTTREQVCSADESKNKKG